MNFNLDRDFDDEIEDALLRVLSDKRYILGPEVASFEREWASYNNLPCAVGVGNGTDAIRMTLLALGIQPGDEVITPAFNVAYTAQAVTAIGARNVYVDVDRDTMLMDLSKISGVVTERTRAIVPVHLYGQMVDMEQLSVIAHRHGLIVVEDAAQAHGAKFDNYRPGWFSDAACYSHYPTKNLGAIGEAGSVTTRLQFVAQRLRLLRDAGRSDRYVHLLPGINSTLDEIQAAVLRVKLPHLEHQNARRSRLARRYQAELSGVGDIIFQMADRHAAPVHHLFVIRTRSRSMLMECLVARGIPSLSHYPCTMPRQPFAVSESLDQGPFPVSDECAHQVLSLPLWPSMTDDEQDDVIQAVREFYAHD